MPQVWMTYEELAAFLDLDVVDAKAQVAYRSLDRKKSRDGYTRVKLDHDMTMAFFLSISRSHFDADQSVDQLRRTHREMVKVDAAHTANGRGRDVIRRDVA